MSYRLAILLFFKNSYLKDADRWFSVKDVSKVMSLSINRARSHLTFLVLERELETKVDGWSNIYKLKKR